MERIKLILIGGTSHVGKSTLGRRLAEERAWDCLSTDQLARHPGRPWKVGEGRVPDDVVQHYTELSVPELAESVLLHYRNNVWPVVDAIIHSRLNNPFDIGLVLEGSAILPDMCSMAEYARVGAMWLTAPDHLIAGRIKQSSRYETSTAAERRLVDAFLERSIAFNRIIKDSAESNGQSVVDASSGTVFETLRSFT